MLVTWLVELFFARQLHSDFRDIIISPVAGQDPADHAGDLAGGTVLCQAAAFWLQRYNHFTCCRTRPSWLCWWPGWWSCSWPRWASWRTAAWTRRQSTTPSRKGFAASWPTRASRWVTLRWWGVSFLTGGRGKTRLLFFLNTQSTLMVISGWASDKLYWELSINCCWTCLLVQFGRILYTWIFSIWKYKFFNQNIIVFCGSFVFQSRICPVLGFQWHVREQVSQTLAAVVSVSALNSQGFLEAMLK